MFSFFKKKDKQAEKNNEELKNITNDDTNDDKEPEVESQETSELELELEPKPVKWIEVEGYKGMDKDMKGRYNFQYEVGKTYKVKNPDLVKTCAYGFHFSLNLNDVFNYYGLTSNNRFFKVKALVREEDYNEYGEKDGIYSFSQIIDKLAAKEITILEEVSTEEMFKEIKRIHNCTIMIDKLEIADMKEIYQKGVMFVLVKKCSNIMKEKIGVKDAFVHLLLKELTNREKLVLIGTSLALYDEIKDRDLLILAMLEEKERIANINKK